MSLTSYLKRIRVVGLADNGDINKVIATWDSPAVADADTNDPNEHQVMVEFPRLWYKEYIDASGNLEGVDVADYPKIGLTLHPCFSWHNGRDVIYIGAFEASGATQLQSISGVKPVTDITIATFRNRAIARVSGATQTNSNWHIMGFWQQHLLDLLFYAYFETRDSQHSTNGLPGYTESSGWHTDYMRECGRSNILTTVNGSVTAQLDTGEDDNDLAAVLSTGDKIANRFLWIENIFGHIWKFNDGCAYVPTSTVGVTDWTGEFQAVYHTPDIRDFSSVQSEILADYQHLTNTDPIAVATTAIIQNTGKCFVPTVEGGNTGQNWCATFYSYLTDSGKDYLRVVLAGGSLTHGAIAGVACRYVPDALSSSHTLIGARLCFSKI